MNKTELMENYTSEQLADKYLRLQEEFNRYVEVIKGIVSELPEELENGTEFHLEISRLQSEVEKYRKSFEDAKKERDCQVAEYQKKIEELTVKNEKLKGGMNEVDCKENGENKNNFYDIFSYHARNLTKDDLLMFLGILTKELVENGIDFRYEMEKELKVWDIKIKRDNKDIADFLPTEPIKVADMLINAEGEYEHNPVVKKICGTDKGAYRIFDVSELRQIAKHLLIYCNHNKEEEE